MNKLRLPHIVIAVIALAMLVANIINIPRGPQLHCYKDTTTYTARQASYGFPFVFMQGNISGDTCSLPIAELNDTNYLTGNEYNFSLGPLIFNVGVTGLLIGGVYFIDARNKPSKRSGNRSKRK
jgi:hypothetical protein